MKAVIDEESQIIETLRRAAEQRTLHLVHPSLLTKENMQLRIGEIEVPILLVIAENQNLDQVPRELFDEDTVLLADNFGRSVLQKAAQTGQLPLIPGHLLTLENLAIYDAGRVTVRDSALGNERSRAYIERIEAERVGIDEGAMNSPLAVLSKILGRTSSLSLEDMRAGQEALKTLVQERQSDIRQIARE